jgi:hypothetical protein
MDRFDLIEVSPWTGLTVFFYFIRLHLLERESHTIIKGFLSAFSTNKTTCHDITEIGGNRG